MEQVNYKCRACNAITKRGIFQSIDQIISQPPIPAAQAVKTGDLIGCVACPECGLIEKLTPTHQHDIKTTKLDEYEKWLLEL